MCKFKFGRRSKSADAVSSSDSSGCCLWSSKRLIMTVINRPCKLCRRLSSRYKIERALLIPNDGKKVGSAGGGGDGCNKLESDEISGERTGSANGTSSGDAEKSLLATLECKGDVVEESDCCDAAGDSIKENLASKEEFNKNKGNCLDKCTSTE